MDTDFRINLARNLVQHLLRGEWAIRWKIGYRFSSFVRSQFNRIYLLWEVEALIGEDD